MLSTFYKESFRRIEPNSVSNQSVYIQTNMRKRSTEMFHSHSFHPLRHRFEMTESRRDAGIKLAPWNSGNLLRDSGVGENGELAAA